MKLFFIFLLSIILLTILPVKSSISFEEQPQSNLAKTPRVLNINYYDDNTIVARIVRLNYTAPPKVCLEERLTIRTIYPNGTVKGFDLSAETLNIQSFNFCLLTSSNPLRFYPIRTNLLLITYTIAADENNPYTYEDWGMIIDLDGVIKSKAKLSQSYVNSTTNEWIPGRESIVLNVHRDNGFIRGLPITGTKSSTLQQFKVNENGEIQSLAVTYMNYTAIPTEMVATMDGGYAVIYPDYTPSTLPLAPYMSIRGFFLQNGNPEPQGPFVLYQTSNPVSKIILLDCDFTKVGFGQTCIMVLNIAPAIDQNTFVKIDFLSTGTVYNITTFQNPADLTSFSIQSLNYGGYFLFSTLTAANNMKLVYGYILDEHSNRYDWNISYPTITNFSGDILVLPNNTLVIPQRESGQTWRLLTTDLYKIEGARDHGYANLHISGTTPNINDIINPSEISTLIITFYSKVNLTPNRKVTILQDGGIIRQITSVSDDNGEFVKSIDDYTIEIKVIGSTFNQPNTKYYVLIDDGFVESKDLKEPIIGLQDNAWNFMTIQQEVTQEGLSNYYENKVNASSIDGKVRLSPEGTTFFKTFKHDKIKVKEFFGNLTQELAKAIPVELERISTNGRHEIDTSTSPEQYILSINIKKAKNKNDRSVNLVASDLDTLIRSKLVTVIGSGEYSNYLDEEYGYEPIPRWIEENLGSLLGTIALNIVLLSLAYWSRNFAIFTCGNAIEKFVTTILFTSIDAGSVENIFTVSLFFVTFPFIVNLGFAFKVVFNELLRHDLRKLLESIRRLKDDVISSIDESKSKKKVNDTANIVNDTANIGNDTANIANDSANIANDSANIANDTANIANDSANIVNDSANIVNDTANKVDGSKHRSIKEYIKRSIKGYSREEKVKKLIKVIRETTNELTKIKEELTEVSDLAEKLKTVNETLKDPVDVKATTKDLVEINDLIKELTQVEDFTEELVDVSKHLDELKKLLDELNEINAGELKEVIVNEKELGVEVPRVVDEAIVREFIRELTKLNKLMEGLKEVEELKEQLNKAVDLMNELKKKDPTSKKEFIDQLEYLNRFKRELEKTSIEELQEEEEEFNEHREFTEDYIKEGKGEEREEENKRSSVWEKVKRFSTRFTNLQESLQEKAINAIEKDQPEKKSRKISKWLRDYRDSQTIIVIFTILAGVDIAHLELLGSKLRIKIPSINYCGHVTRNVDVNFNAKLSHSAEHSLYWGDITNIIIEDISTAFIQSFYLTQVVSFGYTPIYTITKSIIHLATNLHHIYQYKRNSSNTNTDKPNDSVKMNE